MAQQRTIWIDPRTSYPARVLDHELLHLKHPNWTEAQVLREEAKRWKAMTWRQKAQLLKLLAKAEIKGAD